MSQEVFKPAYVRATPKAMAVYREVTDDAHTPDVQVWGRLRELDVRRLADDSPYFIGLENGLRYVFCVCKGTDPAKRRMCLVNVQLDKT